MGALGLSTTLSAIMLSGTDLKTFLILIGAIVLAIIAGVLIWLVFHIDNEATRAADEARRRES